MKITRQPATAIHNQIIISQFSQQAVPFAELPEHLQSMRMLIEMSGVSVNDIVLDDARGPGLLACEFAKVSRHVTGIDITKKMIEQAKKRQRELGLKNVSWDISTVSPLPYDSASFSVVLTRYSFHHFLEPKAVLSERIRVCKPDGIVLITDVALPANKVDAYNRTEKLRDPSHTQALSYDEWEHLMRESALKNLQRKSYQLGMELEKQLHASFPNPGDEEKIRDIFLNDIGVNSLGMDAHWSGNEIYFFYPIIIYAGNK